MIVGTLEGLIILSQKKQAPWKLIVDSMCSAVGGPAREGPKSRDVNNIPARVQKSVTPLNLLPGPLTGGLF